MGKIKTTKNPKRNSAVWCVSAGVGARANEIKHNTKLAKVALARVVGFVRCAGNDDALVRAKGKSGPLNKKRWKNEFPHARLLCCGALVCVCVCVHVSVCGK